MELSEARLAWWEKIVPLQLTFDHLLDDLGYEGDVGNRSVVHWVGRVQAFTIALESTWISSVTAAGFHLELIGCTAS